jgi:hypothetical protein
LINAKKSAPLANGARLAAASRGLPFHFAAKTTENQLLFSQQNFDHIDLSFPKISSV